VRSYGQYCPIARASEVLAERWTPLILRNLMFGADTFNTIARGVPLMSRSMLVTRLAELERAGVVARGPKESGRGSRYGLTRAGLDLAGVLDELAAWGERWVDVGPEMTDPGFALWAWCMVQVDEARLPSGRTVVAFRFPDQPASNRHYWLLVEGGRAEVCYTDPGGEAAATVVAESQAFIEWHRGRLPWSRALLSGRIRVIGQREIAAAIPTWNRHAPVMRPAVRSSTSDEGEQIRA
jgi:DNA-binding HxlR family transcriptional regulator